MVNIARSHSEAKIVESLKRLQPELNFGTGTPKSIEVGEPTSKARYIDVTVRFELPALEFDQVLTDSLEEPKGRTAYVA